MVKLDPDVSPPAVHVRARPALIRSALFGAVAGGIPLFVVLYWLSIEQGSWQRVVIAQVIYVGFFAIVAVRHHGAFLEITPTMITKRALLLRTTVKTSDVASVYLSDVQQTSAQESLPQLVALAADGRRLFRLRGTFWDRDSMLSVANAIGAPLTVESHHHTMKDFYAAHPGTAYWYEGKLSVAIVGIIVAFGVAYLMLSWVMHAIGVQSVLTLPF